MSGMLKCRPAALAALLLAGLTAACGKSAATNPNLACSAAAPGGYCAGTSICVSGACVDSASLCSGSNPSGSCSSGSTCFSGGCVLSASLCSATNTDGVCEDGKTCFGGSCTAAASLCSSSNITGICPPGSTCFAGGCVVNSALCSSTVSNGVCAVGNTCFQGNCVAVGTLCSTSNTAGSCPTGQTCQAGQCAGPAIDPCSVNVYSAQPSIAVAKGSTCVAQATGAPVCTASTPAGVLTVDGLKFKDLSKDGKLDAYEDWRKSEICRARDLVSKLTLPQKIGLMTEVSNIGAGSADGSFAASVQTLITTGFARQALIRLNTGFGNTFFSGAQLATYMNNLQELSESQPLGIPFVATADPAHGFSMNIDGTTGAMAMGAASNTGGVGNSSLVQLISMWPQPLGIGALNDPAIAKQAGDAIRREFRGMGMRWELGPQADIATEPRWARMNNTFGENPYAVGTMVRYFMEGMQGIGDGGLKSGGGVATTLKHFPGTGANQQGLDSHSYLGRFNVYPGNNFMAHVYPFRAAVAAGAAAVMPSYSIFKGQYAWDPLQVGAAQSKEIVTDLLKTQLGFTGLVSSDWGVIGKAYGVENLTAAQKGALFIQAGSHQLGRENASDSIQLAYLAGLISDAELDNAVAKILEMSFKLGIFENPYTDYPTAVGTPTTWTSYVRSAEARTNGFNAQKMAMVLLRNRDHASGNAYLPIDPTRKVGTTTQAIDDTNNDGTIKVYFDGINDSIVGVSASPTAPIDSMVDVFGDYDYTAAATATTSAIAATTDLAQADVAIIRIVARKGAYSGLDAGVPLSFDAPFPGTSNDSEGPRAKISRNKVIDALRVRDGYTKFDGTVVAATNTNLKIVLVMHMDRPGIVKPFINGLINYNDSTTNRGTASAPDYYPLVSDETNIFVPAAGNNPVTNGVDAFIVEFGAFDRAVLDFVFNKNKPAYLAPGQTVFHYGTARLPVEIPSTDAAVAAQLEDLPADSLNPTYLLGAGSTYTQ